MALAVPNIESITNGSTGLDFQAVTDKTDFDALQAALVNNPTFVISGMEVTQDTGSDMKIAVASGAYMINGVTHQYAGTGGSPLTITAASATDRRDIIEIDTSGTVYDTTGTACGTAGWTRTSSSLPPVKPPITANRCLLGEVGVTSSTTVITTAINVVDKTVNLGGINTIRGTPSTAASGTLTASSANLIAGTSIPLGTGELQVGSAYRITVGVNKTAAGTATWKADVKFGTANTTSDSSIATFTSGTNTALLDQGHLIIYVTVTALGSGTSATASCLAFWSHGGSQSTGLGSIPAVGGTTAGFNSTATNPFFHVDITPGASAVMTAWGLAEQVG